MKSILDYALDYLSQGIPAIPSDPKTKAPLVKWSEYQTRLPTIEETKEMFRQFPRSMISVVTGRISSIVVIDADSQEAVEKIEEHIPDSFETVIDVSPRGGKHYWFLMNGIEYKSKTSIFEKCDIKANGGVLCVPPSRNDTGGEYRWLTQLDFKRSLLHPMPESLKKFIDPLCLTLNINNNIYNKNASDVPKEGYFSIGRRDNDLFSIANGLIKSGVNIILVSEVLKRLIVSWGENADKKWINDKIESALKRQEWKERNLTEEIREWVLTTNGNFLTTCVYKDLDLTTRDNKKKAVVYLLRLVEEGIIERFGEKRGCYRKVEKEMELMDYENVSTESVDILFPFHLHDVAKIMPKAIIVVAGSTNSGKTSFFLNTIKLNMGKFEKFYYFNSETSAESFRDRLDKFGEPISYWKKKLEVVNRTRNFSDVIQPNGVNIIDYLELDPEKTFMVSGLIRDIFNKLDKGIAIIGLQKASNASFGRGGEFTLEKAQLAISLDYDKAKIVKCKSPKSGFNYHNAVMDFGISQGGALITEKSGWKQE